MSYLVVQKMVALFLLLDPRSTVYIEFNLDFLFDKVSDFILDIPVYVC